jgi:hypothetical protein
MSTLALPFILIMEGFSLLLKKSFSEHKISGIKVSKLINIVHLMFVDDLLLMSKADLAEWSIIQEVLSRFCSASGLSINLSKSSVHYWGLSEPELIIFKRAIPYTFIDLREGLKYLGFQLKIGASSPDDWLWLVKLFEKKIGGWCNKWLSLGGRFILVKTVLEGLAVYWMTLEKIPRKIINTLRRLSTNFLWNGHGNKHCFHLCSWEILARPRKAGGWGLKNLHTFNTALLASSFWRALTLDSIWHNIVVDKYLGSANLSDWLRKQSLHQKNASPFWKGLVRSSPIILHWLRWKPGTGIEIQTGRDMIVGLDDRSLLHPELCSKLTSQNFHYLAHINLSTGSSTLPDHWLSDSDLSLSGRMATDWNFFTFHLKCAGISLNEDPDTLVWTGGDASGIPSVKNIYEALLNIQNPAWI